MNFACSFGNPMLPTVTFGNRTAWLAPRSMREDILAHPEGKRWAVHREEDRGTGGELYVYAGPLLVVFGYVRHFG